MFEDRYLPADDLQDYELKRGGERKHSSRHKHDSSSSKHKKKSPHRERSASRERGRKRLNERKEHSSVEIEDGEMLEDGEIAEAADGLSEPPAAAAADAAAANGNHKASEDASAGVKEVAERPSSRPPSRRSHSREHSKEPAAAGSSKERKSSKDGSKDGSRDPRDKTKSTREPSRRERSRERSSSSRRARESDGQQQQQQREREQPSRSRPGSRERPVAAAAPPDRHQRRSDSSRQYDRDRERQYDRDRELRYNRDRERGGRYRSERDRRYDLDSRDARGVTRRSSRSRSRGRRGQEYERDRDRQYKRSRDERDREDSKRRRRSSDSEPELQLDATALLEGDALGLTAAQKEEEEQQRRLEESRRRRHEILAKHQQAATVAAPTATAAAAGAAADEPQQQQQQDEAPAEQAPAAAVEPAAAAAAAAAPAAAAAAEDDGAATPEGDRTSSDDSHNAPGSPVMDIWNAAAPGGGEVSSRAAAGPGDEQQPTSQLPALPGAEPNMQSERLRVGLAAAAAAGGGGGGAAADAGAAAAGAGAADAAAGGGGDDMFAAEDDMFAAAGAEGAGAALRRGPAVPAGLTDSYDDAEGYYNFQVGELLDARYEVFACKGKGVFSTVLRARDLARQVSSTTGQLLPGVGPGPLAAGAEHPEVAIKVIRANETMSKAAALEQRILRLLADKDPDNRKHCIRLLRTFEYRQHVCMVFEPLDMNLRELTLKYGRNVGLNITAVAIYAAQLLVALRHLQQCRVLHADIKPDNILVNARRSKVKICDLGSAMLAGENERTPYLVSRFYRAPEVILGLAYDFPMDVWSVGCVLYELFTGKILFPGRSNNEMLKLMMDVKGPFPKKMLKKGIFVEKHFEDDTSMSFALVEEDPVTKQPIRRVIANPTVKHNFSQLLARAEGDRAQLAALADLLEKMLALDPDKRIQADAALRHPFVKPWLPKKKGAAGTAAV